MSVEISFEKICTSPTVFQITLKPLSVAGFSGSYRCRKRLRKGRYKYREVKWFLERHGFCSQIIHIYYPMKRLQLWLLTVLFYCAASGQSTDSPKDLPVTASENNLFSVFTVSSQNGRALLRWAAPVQSEDFFIIEKSQDAEHFEMLSAIGASPAQDSVYSLTDNAAGTGTTFYRVKISGKSGREIYSRVINTQALTPVEFRFYPNPVDKLLIVRTAHALSIQVIDSYGVVLLNQDLDAGMQILNVSGLQKGNYILKATDKTTSASYSEQLIKNN